MHAHAGSLFSGRMHIHTQLPLDTHTHTRHSPNMLKSVLLFRPQVSPKSSPEQLAASSTAVRLPHNTTLISTDHDECVCNACPPLFHECACHHVHEAQVTVLRCRDVKMAGADMLRCKLPGAEMHRCTDVRCKDSPVQAHRCVMHRCTDAWVNTHNHAR